MERTGAETAGGTAGGTAEGTAGDRAGEGRPAHLEIRDSCNVKNGYYYHNDATG